MAIVARPLRAEAAVSSADSRIDSFSVSIPQLGNRPRVIRVYLPAGYDDRGASFPVLYLQDGQQLFAPGPFGDWLIDETMDKLHGTNHAGDMIVVGIDNSEHRWDEYSPWVNHRMHDWIPTSWAKTVQGGEGAAYLDFVVNTLKPEIDRRYRTLADRAHTGIGGSSMGALIALYAGLSRPDVFSRVMAMSTAVWFAEDGGAWLSNNQLLGYEKGRTLPHDVRFYIDVGTRERSRDTDPDVVDAAGHPVTYSRAYLEGTEAVVGALRAGGVPSSNLLYVVEPDAAHHEIAWAGRFAHAVEWLYQ
jgi:predicted alpha/beta superfamily hydrolase